MLGFQVTVLGAAWAAGGARRDAAMAPTSSATRGLERRGRRVGRCGIRVYVMVRVGCPVRSGEERAVARARGDDSCGETVSVGEASRFGNRGTASELAGYTGITAGAKRVFEDYRL